MMKDQQIKIQELQQQLRQRQGSVKANGALASGGNIKLSWRDGGRAPRRMFGEVVAVDRGVAYFRPEGYKMQIVLAYNSASSKWSELPKCPNYGFSIAVIRSLPTAIGGKTPNDEVTNSLLSFTDTEGGRCGQSSSPPPNANQTPLNCCSVQWKVSGCGGRSGRIQGS